jgi:hypothetical protein
MVGASSAYGQPERHGLQRARFVSGDFESFHLRSYGVGRGTNLPGESATTFRQTISDANTTGDFVERSQECVGVPEAQPRGVEPASFNTFHRQRDRAASADGVESQFVTTARCSQYGIRIANVAKRTECKEIFVLHAHRAAV